MKKSPLLFLFAFLYAALIPAASAALTRADCITHVES